MTSGRKIGVVALLLIPAASLAIFVWALYLVARPPSTGDWARAAEVVRDGVKQGDCVVFDPPWAQEGSPWFEGLDVITSEAVDWYEVGKRERVWVLSWAGRSEPVMPDGYSLVEGREAGSVSVGLYDIPGRGRLLFGFLERIGDASVTRVHKDRRQQCRIFEEDRWHCGAVHPWQYVGRRSRDIAGSVREVIWAHPLNGGKPIEVNYPDVPMGSSLVVRFGLTQRAIETGKGAPVTFRVKVGGDLVIERVIGTTEDGWFEEVVDVSSRRPGRDDVQFAFFTKDHRDRQLCFTADMWD